MAAEDGTYITVASVRRTVGITSTSTISDVDVGAIIAEVEPEIARLFNTVFTPEERIDILDGNDTVRIFLDKNPVLGIRELKIDTDTEDPSYLHVSKGSGKITLDTTQSLTNSVFKAGTQKIVVKYIHGWVVESSTNTTTDTVAVAGSSVALSVVSEMGFAVNDWVEIYSMDGNQEVGKVTATDTGEITVDKLVLGHESGSKVVKLQIHTDFSKLMNIAAALSIVGRIVGQSATDITGYNMAEFRVQKGEPYTQWRETAIQLIRLRDEILARRKPRMYVVV